jgi:hypothetical protein
MNHHFKSAAIAVLLVLPAVATRADQTNLVQNLSVRLAGISQGPTETNRNIVTTTTHFVRVNTADIIKQLGTATGSSFSSAANLVLITPLGIGAPSIAVRDRAASVDVSSFFVYEVKSGTVTSSELNLKSGRGSSTDYSIQRLALLDSYDFAPLTLHLDVQGVAVESATISPNRATRSGLEAGVSGWGDQGGTDVLLEGTFQLDGGTFEIMRSGPPPNA